MPARGRPDREHPVPARNTGPGSPARRPEPARLPGLQPSQCDNATVLTVATPHRDGSHHVRPEGPRPGPRPWPRHRRTVAGAAVLLAILGPVPSNVPARAPLWSTGTFRQAYADIQLAAHGWTQGQARQFGCLDNIWLRESKWDELAGSPASAYGIPQASPGAKMAAAGPDWLTSPQTQIRWGDDYIEDQYGTPCQAWAYWQVHKN